MARRPNIVFIMSDDHAANALSAYGSRLASVFRTPHMDRIAREGARLDNCYSTNAICTPARATIMTGQYGHLNGVRTLKDGLDPTRDTFVRHLQAAGYVTALLGKWHLHSEPVGFDVFKVLDRPGPNRAAGQQGTYQDPWFVEASKGFVRHRGYVTDIITEMTLDFLRRRDTARPFFLMCHHKAPHDFWEYAERHEHLLDGVEVPEPDSLFEDRSHRSDGSRDYGSSIGPRSSVRSLYADFSRPDYVTGPLTGTEGLSFEDKTRAAYRKYLRDYLRTVAGIDESVGAVLAELARQGILDETLVIYTSDQGMFLGEHDYQDKRWSFEESLRCPMVVRYPREIPPGSVNDDVITNLDLAPLMLDFAGLDVPESLAVQGRSFRPNLAGHTPADWRHEVYFRYWMHRAHRHDVPAHYGLRTKRWKLTFFYGLPLDATGCLDEPTPPGWELYDMAADPFELKNLYDDPAYAEVARDMTARLDAAKRRYGDDDDLYPELTDLRRKTRPIRPA